MKTRAETLMDIISNNSCRISDLKSEIAKLEEEARVARANLRELVREGQDGKDL